MNYQQLTIKTTKDNAAFIEEVSLGLGALSVDFSDSFDNPILEPSVGETPLWEDITLKILFDESVDKQFILTQLLEICNASGEFEFIADKNWQKECNKNFSITQFGNGNTPLWICPSWENCENLEGVVIKMDPGMAFGTGSHHTTSLCLHHLANNPPTNKRVIDFGTGSGILAIAAQKLGAKSIVAIDNDPQSILATVDNAKANHSVMDIFHAEEVSGEKILPADVLIANILTSTLLELRDYLNTLVVTGGKIILSGILIEQQQQIIESYSKYFENFQVQHSGDWMGIVAHKK